jgi:hypothetical protein
VNASDGKTAKETGAIGPLRLTKAPDDQICNLCLKERALTDDHVPTKGWGNDRLIRVRRLRNDEYSKPAPPITCRGGVRFRTLCAECNNSRLGGNIDAALAELVAVCKKQFEREKSTFTASLRPSAILRAILGHMVAVRPHTERDMTLDVMAREFLVQGKPLSPHVHVNVWRFLVPDELVIGRDIVVGDTQTQQTSGILNVIKFYPIAAVVQLDGATFDAPSFSEFANVPTSEYLDLTLQFSTPFHPNFPEEAAWLEPRYFQLVGKGYADGLQRDPTDLTRSQTPTP